jgi:hypothetical protein
VLATDRLLEVEQAWGDKVQRIIPLELDGEALRIVMYLWDGSNLRITEQWQGQRLLRYSYYWLTQTNELQVGWDNAPHHTHLANFPHHKHVGTQGNLQPSSETSLDQVLAVVLSR